jgi:hypothetical protein
VTDLTGTGLAITGNALTLVTSGDWSGTFDGQEGAYYLANSFSTTSANYWETTQTARTADDLSNNTLNDLSDVATTSVALGDLLYWNGTNWTDVATSSLGLGNNTFLGLSDTIGAYNAGRILFEAAGGVTDDASFTFTAGLFTAPYFTMSSTTATSTIAGGLAVQSASTTKLQTGSFFQNGMSDCSAEGQTLLYL